MKKCHRIEQISCPRRQEVRGSRRPSLLDHLTAGQESRRPLTVITRHMVHVCYSSTVEKSMRQEEHRTFEGHAACFIFSTIFAFFFSFFSLLSTILIPIPISFPPVCSGYCYYWRACLLKSRQNMARIEWAESFHSPSTSSAETPRSTDYLSHDAIKNLFLLISIIERKFSISFKAQSCKKDIQP